MMRRPVRSPRRFRQHHSTEASDTGGLRHGAAAALARAHACARSGSGADLLLAVLALDGFACAARAASGAARIRGGTWSASRMRARTAHWRVRHPVRQGCPIGVPSYFIRGISQASPPACGLAMLHAPSCTNARLAHLVVEAQAHRGRVTGHGPVRGGPLLLLPGLFRDSQGSTFPRHVVRVRAAGSRVSTT